MKSTRKIGALLLCVLICLMLCFVSCGKDSAAQDSGAGSYDKNESIAGGMNDGDVTVNVTSNGQVGTKIIKTFDLSAETTDFDAAITSLNELVSTHGGYVESASTNNQSLTSGNTRYSRSASYTLRIPAENAEAFVGSVGNSLHVTSNRSYVEDISETYYSIEAKLEELQVERDSLLDILEQTETKQDYDLWLTVKQRLSEVTQQIAVYQGQLNRYDSQVAYSTVNLSVREVLSLSSVSEDNRFVSRLGAAFADGWNGFVEGMQDFVIWFAEALPTLILFAIIITAAVLIIRKLRKKKKQKNDKNTL